MLRLLSIKYEKRNRKDLLEIIVNATPHVIEETGYDNWDGGQHEHDIEMTIPESLFFNTHSLESELSTEICQDINLIIPTVIPAGNESIRQVIITVDTKHNEDWRNKHDDLVIQPTKQVADTAKNRIWENGQFKSSSLFNFRTNTFINAI